MDISATIFKIFRKLFQLAIRMISSMLMRSIMFFKGIQYGSKVRFIGLSTIIRYPNSEIELGNNVELRSNTTSNLIGINRRCIFSTNAKGASLKIGDNCGFSGTVIGTFKEITLGEKVRCGANTLITDSDWHLDDNRSGDPKSIEIGDNVWLGINVIVLKGVTIGDNTIIGANSVVTKNMPANVIAAGNPCKVLKDL